VAEVTEILTVYNTYVNIINMEPSELEIKKEIKPTLAKKIGEAALGASAAYIGFKIGDLGFNSVSDVNLPEYIGYSAAGVAALSRLRDLKR
jgi:hypothetical protein